MIDRINRIATRILAKSRPDTLFEQAFFDMNERIKEMRKKRGDEIVAGLQKRLEGDFRKRGYKFDVSVKLGSFRGHPYVTSAIVNLQAKKPFGDGDGRVDDILSYLQKTYSPKYKFKGIKDGVAKFNIR